MSNIPKFVGGLHDISSALSMMPLGKDAQKAVSIMSISASIGTSLATMNPLPALTSIAFSSGKFLTKIPVIGGLFKAIGFGGGKRTITKKIWVDVFTWPAQIDAGNGIVFEIAYPSAGSKLSWRIKVKCRNKHCDEDYTGHYKGSPMGLYTYDLEGLDLKLCMLVCRVPIEGCSVDLDKMKKHLNDYMYSFEYLFVCRNDEFSSVINAVRNKNLIFNYVEGTLLTKIEREVYEKLKDVPDSDIKVFLRKYLKFRFVQKQLEAGAVGFTIGTHPKKGVKILRTVPEKSGLVWIDTDMVPHLATSGFVIYEADGRVYVSNYYDAEFNNPAPIVSFKNYLAKISAGELASVLAAQHVIGICSKFPSFKRALAKELRAFLVALRLIYQKDKSKVISVIDNMPADQKALLDYLFPGWKDYVFHGSQLLTPTPPAVLKPTAPTPTAPIIQAKMDFRNLGLLIFGASLVYFVSREERKRGRGKAHREV